MARIDHEAVLVVGGRLGDTMSKGWLTNVVTEEGGRFVTADKSDGRFSKLINDDFSMVDEVTRLRNLATEAMMMASCSTVSDPMADTMETLPKRPRRELFDDIGKTVVVAVSTASGTCQMRVMASCNPRAKLQFELTDTNINIFVQQPVDDTSECMPTVHEDDVRWLQYRHGVTCRYFDGDKYKVKTMAVARGPGVQERATQMASVMQSFYKQHNNNEPM
jgi:hypothetical protein